MHIYDFHIFIVMYSPLGGLIWNQHNDQLPVGLLAQLVWRCVIAEVVGSNPVRAWIYFKPYIHYYLTGSAHNCSILGIEKSSHIILMACTRIMKAENFKVKVIRVS